MREGTNQTSFERRILEQFLQSKSVQPGSEEDGIYCSDYHFAVLDGATFKGGRLWEGKKTGRIAMELVHAALSKLDPNLNATESMVFLNESIANWYRSIGEYEYMRSHPADRCTTSIVIYSSAYRELWFLGDCQALVDGNLIKNEKLIDIVTSGARAAYIESELAEGKTLDQLQRHDTGREFIMPLLERQNHFQNNSRESPYNYAVLDGFFQAAFGLKVISIPSSTHELVLATDGYPELAPDLETSEKNLRAILKADPMLYHRYKSTKGLVPGNLSHDDRAYLRILT